MKKVYFLLMIVLATATAWSQKTWIGPVVGGNWNEPSFWLPAGVPVSGDTVVISGGVTGTITNVALDSNVIFEGFRIEGGSTVTLTSPENRTISIEDEFGHEDFFIEEGSSLTLGEGATGVNIVMVANFLGEALIAGEFIINPGRTFNCNNSNSSDPSWEGTRVTGVIANSGVVISNLQSLQFQGGGIYIHARDGGSIPRATWLAASNCNITGVQGAAAPGGLDQAFGNFTWNNAIQTGNKLLAPVGMSVAGTFSVVSTGAGAGRLRMNQGTLPVGNFDLSGGVLEMGSDAGGGASRILEVAGDVSISGGTLSMSTSPSRSGTVKVAGNFSHTGGLITETAPGASGSIIFNGTAVQTFSKVPAATISNEIDFTINTAAQVDFGTSILDGSSGNFTLSGGAKIIVAHPGGLRSGNVTNGTIQVTGQRTYSNAADYEFQGASTGTFNTPGNRVRDLIINNTTPTSEVVAPRRFLVDGTLALINGYLTPTAGNPISVNMNGTASTVNGAFVNGPLTKRTNTLDLFTFPVGKVDGGLRMIGVKPTTNTEESRYTAQFFRAAAPAGTLGAGLTRVSGCEYWNLARTEGTAPAAVTLSWESSSACGGGYVTSLADLRVAHLTGGTWLNEGNAAVTGTPAAGTITSEIVNTFSPFALASSSAANPLPVVFADVKAYEKNNGVQIEWSNLTEKDVAEYTIERSANGHDFSAISQQLPTSNQNDKASYSAFDASPAQGTNYYRIKAAETTGKIVYSKILSVSLGQANKGLKLYPNPVSGNQVTISLSNVKRGQYNLRVINTAGQDIHKQMINNQGSTMTQTIDLPSSIKPGVYNMIITGSDYRESKMFIVR